jgi:hypothetical protein
MKTEYLKQYNKSLIGEDWILYHDLLLLKDTIIFFELLDFLKTNRHLEFKLLKSYIHGVYKRSKARSKCRIDSNDNKIEIFKPNNFIFPKIYILPHDKENEEQKSKQKKPPLTLQMPCERRNISYIASLAYKDGFFKEYNYIWTHLIKLGAHPRTIVNFEIKEEYKANLLKVIEDNKKYYQSYYK